MKKILAIGALASALGVAMPAAAEAGLLTPAVGINGGAEVQLVKDGHDRYNSKGYDRSRSRHNDGRDDYNSRSRHDNGYDNHRSRSQHDNRYNDHRSQRSYSRGEARSWGHWRPYVERRHYHSFSAPTYYRHHPRYGDYYRVRAHDRNNVAVWLGISAITGAILFSNY
ncbi:MAG: hypothetical protein CVT83_08440 [Alphaproteobacteria bacterium HGW-Alphaproteobacteria-5]|nr:MAG: hypothetical protein CVT83_08440 [Alphaproteobacteria bacterium HGW-Alphaproteobacteria-5]